jgi:hypothetical protein
MTGDRPRHLPWPSLIGWTLGGVLVSAGILFGFGLLLPMSLVGVALLAFTAIRGHSWPEALASLIGPGLFLLAIGYAAANPGEPICSADRHFVLHPGQSYRCTEAMSPWPWLTLGVGAVGVGTVGYGIAYRSVRRHR